MANRLATSTDVSTYGNGMQVNDIILDTPSATVGGRVQMNFTLSAFSGARNSCTIWINGNVGEIYQLNINNGGTVWPQSDISKSAPVTVRPLPGTKVRYVRNSSSNSGYTSSFSHLRHVAFEMENDTYPGMRDGVGAHSPFLTGQFGMEITSGEGASFRTDGANQFVIFGVDGGSISLTGIECRHGFAMIRINAQNQNVTVDLTIKRCYLHDSLTGEGFYIGMTSGTPVPKFRNFLIEDCILARTGTEAVQLQHFLRGSQRSIVRNLVVFAAAVEWLNAFGGFQDNGVQLLYGDGDCWFENVIIDGFGDNGFNINGSDQGSSKSLPTVVQNCLINDGRNSGIYFNANTTNGLTREWRKLYFRQFNNTYDEVGTLRSFVISQNNGTETHKFVKCQWDGSKTSLFQSTTGYEIIGFTNAAMDAPEYVNSGFHEPAEKIETWKQTYSSGGNVSWKVGDIAINVESGQEYAFYKCLNNHTATATRPRLDTTNWVKLTWDESGVRSDQVGWASGDTQSNYPPDDFRLVADNIWNKRGMGIYSNEQNTDYTQFQWKRADNAAGTVNVREIPKGRRRKYTPQLEDKGKYLSLFVRKKTGAGYGSWQNSTWKLVS